MRTLPLLVRRGERRLERYGLTHSRDYVPPSASLILCERPPTLPPLCATTTDNVDSCVLRPPCRTSYNSHVSVGHGVLYNCYSDHMHMLCLIALLLIIHAVHVARAARPLLRPAETRQPVYSSMPLSLSNFTTSSCPPASATSKQDLPILSLDLPFAPLSNKNFAISVIPALQAR